MRSRHRIQGPVFDSFRTQNEPQPRREWRPNLVGRRQRIKIMMRVLKSYLDSTDADHVNAGQAAMFHFRNLPEKDCAFMALQVMLRAHEISRDVPNMTWPKAVDYVLTKLTEAGQTSALNPTPDATAVTKTLVNDVEHVEHARESI